MPILCSIFNSSPPLEEENSLRFCICQFNQEVTNLIKIKYSGAQRLHLFKAVKASYSQTHLGVSQEPNTSLNIYTLLRQRHQSQLRKKAILLKSHSTLLHPEDCPTKSARKSQDFLCAQILRFPKNEGEKKILSQYQKTN